MDNFSEAVYVCPIEGWNLVEASAGTGKTYQVQNLFARLIMEKGWSIDSILVVTFTEAATEELRERLQGILNDCIIRLDAHADGNSETDQVGIIIEHAVANLRHVREGEGLPLSVSQARALCRIRARAAVLDFDNAAISTIHGFCSRMLGECAFECGADFDAELVTDKTQLLEEVVRDVWRQLVLPLDGEDAELAADKLKFDDVVRLVSSVLNKPGAKVLPALEGSRSVDALTMPLFEGVRGVATSTAEAIDSELAYLLAQWHLGQPAVLQLQKTRGLIASGDRDAFRDWTTKALKNRFVPPDPFLPALAEFSAACETLKLAYDSVANRLGNWKPELNQREDCRAAWITVARLWRESDINDLKHLRDSEWVGRFFKADTSKALSVANLAAFDLVVGESEDAAFEPHFKILTKLTTGVLKKQRRKTVVVPLGPAISALRDASDAIERAVGNRDDWVIWMKRRIVEASRERLESIKRSRNLMTYDDLLVRLRDALSEDATGPLLKQAIRSRYQIAIIDEFQDTDPVQYGVFEEGFKKNGLPVFVVGDPKQAIYGFRSGDLATYISARDALRPENRFELTTNWRSQPAIVEAVNELFEESAGDIASGTVNRAFATNEMTYRASGSGKKAVEGDADKPMVVELHELEVGGKVGGRKLAAKLTAERIAHLLRERQVQLGDKSVAVLVGTHAEARFVKEQLAVLDPPIAAVLQSSGKIFESEQAQDFRFILQAMLEPADVSAVRAAMATPVLEGKASDLVADVAGAVASALVQKASADFLEANKAWQKVGLVVAFGRLSVAQGIRNLQLGLADGERRWTNLLQVAELLDRVAREQKLGMHAVARWLDRQLNGAEQDDAYEIRLESDDRAVEIMTTFKSKGLERDYIFAPFVWAKTPAVTNFTKLLEYHEGDDLVLDLDVKGYLRAGPEEDDAIVAHQDEKLQEHLRLLYVAVTRAKLEAHVIHVTAGGEQRNALSYLLTHEEPPQGPVMGHWSNDDAAPEPGSRSRYQIINDLEATQLYGEGPVASSMDADDGGQAPPRAQARSFSGWIDRNWQILSFSKLAGHGGSLDPHDYDEESGEQRSEAAISETKLRLRKNLDSLFAFKAGKITGNCWHAIFENLDFEARDEGIHETIEKWATLYRLVGPEAEVDDERKIRLGMLFKMVKATLQLQLPLEGGRLDAIAWSDRLAEMQFHFPVNAKGVSRAAIAEVLTNPEYGWERRLEPAIKAVLDKWLKPPAASQDANDDAPNERDDLGVRGFMTGFIDLTFRSGGPGGTYYLLDWKSNQLDGTYEGFTAENIVGEMAHSRYFLQYLLYSAALHQYLKTNLSDYSYGKNFGGAFYIFLRGVCEPPAGLWDGGSWNAVERAVYDDRPPERLLNALWETLAGGEV